MKLADLPPDRQKQFGYDPEKAAWASQKKAYEERIAALETQLGELQNALAKAEQAHSSAPPHVLHPFTTGHCQTSADWFAFDMVGNDVHVLLPIKKTGKNHGRIHAPVVQEPPRRGVPQVSFIAAKAL